MLRRIFGSAAITTGSLLLLALLPFWIEFFTKSPSERPDGHGFWDFYLLVTAIYGLPGALLLVGGLRLWRSTPSPASRAEGQAE